MKIQDSGNSKATTPTSTSNQTTHQSQASKPASAPASRPQARVDRDTFESGPTTASAKRPTTTTVAATANVQATGGTGATDSAIAAQVKKEVQAASKNGADAAQLMTLAHQRAVELVRQQYPNAPPTERMDRAVAIAAYVLNGPGQIDHLAEVDSGNTKTVQYMRDIAANDPTGQSFAGMDLDSTHGGGTFYDSYNDGTANQAYHTNFFVTAGYVAGGNAAMVAKAQTGNIYHETVDPNAWAQGGGSMADYSASSAGIIAGGQLFQARSYAAEYEAGQHPSGGNIDLLEPVMVAGFVSDAGTAPPQVAGMNAAQQQAAQQTMTDIANFRSSFFFQLATEKNPVAALLTGFFQIPPILNGAKPGFN